jgi:hypothetical protein
MLLWPLRIHANTKLKAVVLFQPEFQAGKRIVRITKKRLVTIFILTMIGAPSEPPKTAIAAPPAKKRAGMGHETIFFTSTIRISNTGASSQKVTSHLPNRFTCNSRPDLVFCRHSPS